MQMPGPMPARQTLFDRPLSYGKGAGGARDEIHLVVADDGKAACVAACFAGLTAAKAACVPLGPFAPACVAAAEAAFAYCVSRC
jgi:hypothetical protein